MDDLHEHSHAALPWMPEPEPMASLVHCLPVHLPVLILNLPLTIRACQEINRIEIITKLSFS